MAAERRTTTTRLAEDHAAARADAHRRNIEVARAAMAEAEQRLFRADVTGGLAMVTAEREHQYPLPSFDASAQREEGRRIFTSFLEDAERDRRECASEENRHRHGMVFGCRSDDGVGPSNAPPPPPTGASRADAADEDSDEDHLF
jgi:hypothetical protein